VLLLCNESQPLLGPIFIDISKRRLGCLMLPLARAIRISLMVELPQT
jgi:hypothetical protein